MIYTSTELFNAFLEDTRQIMVKVTIGNRVFDNDNIATLNLEYGSMDGGSLDIGGAFANSLKIGFSELVEGLKELDEIGIELGAVLPDETIEYVKMGTFIINEEVMMDRNNNTTSVDAMDRMVMLGEIYEPTLEGDYARIIDIAVDIANQAGVVVSSDFDRLRTDSIQIPREKTLREAIGIIAQFEVGFATFNRDGELTIRGLKDADFHVSPEEYTMKGLVKNEVPFRLNGVQCQIGDSEEDVLQTGTSTGTQMVLNNPSMTQAHLDRIYTELSTLNYYPFSLDWYGHPALETGDWIEIEDLQGNKFKTPNLHYTLDFNGGLKAKSQAETTSSSEVVYQYKSPLKQEIQAIAARLSASGGNHVYDDLTEPENPKEGDLWFKPEGPDTLILKYTRLEDGTLDWVEKLNTGDTTKNADEIEKTLEEVEEAKRQAKLDAEQALADAKAHADAELERINTALSVDIGGAIDLAEEAKQDAIDKANQALADAKAHAEAEDARIEQEVRLDVAGAIELAEEAKQDAVTKANQAYDDAKAHADAEVQASKEHFDSLIEDVESDVADAQATADSAVEQIDTAITNAGFTSLDETISNVRGIASGVKSELDIAVENAGFTSLDETVQNMTTITMSAEDRAQEAIDNASNAYGLAQTSISEAQTAQANSLSALGKAEDASAGVSDLDIRVDDVEAELELKADNAFMNEDGTLTTLSNAITFNAYRFSSDMSRIESRVNSLAGAQNVLLNSHFKESRKNWGIQTGTPIFNGETVVLNGLAEIYQSSIDIDSGINAMFETRVKGTGMLVVRFGGGGKRVEVNVNETEFKDLHFVIEVSGNRNIIISSISGNLEIDWVKLSTSQTETGWTPAIADTLTTAEIAIFRNEYDEFADKTERRLTTIDTTGGRLDVAENLITQTADGLKAKVDLTTFDELTGEVQEIGSKLDVTAEGMTNRVWKTDIEGAIGEISVGGGNLQLDSTNFETGWVNRNSQNPVSVTVTKIDDVYSNIYVARTNSDSHRLFAYTLNQEKIEVGEEVTVSFDIVNNTSVEQKLHINGLVDAKTSARIYHRIPGNSHKKIISSGVRSRWHTAQLFEILFEADELYLNPNFDIGNLMVQKGNVATGWTPAIEDTLTVIDHIETEWTQTFEGFETTVSDNLGTVNRNIQTLENSLSAISDPVTGRLTIAEQSLDGFRNEVYNADGSSKFTQLATGISSVVKGLDDLEIGGRNLALNSNEGWTSNDYRIFSGELSEDWVVGETYTVTIKGTVNEGQRFGIWRDGGSVRLTWDFVPNEEKTIWKATTIVPETTRAEKNVFSVYNVSSGGAEEAHVEWIKIEKGNKATDWTPAPEDTTSLINHVETEWTQTFDAFELTITGEGGINTQLQTLDSTMSSIADPETGRLSIVEQTASGLQSEVYNADGSSKVTQLANGFNVLVSDFEDYQDGLLNILTHNVYDWELGGFNLNTGLLAPSNTRFRTKSFIPINSVDYISLDSTRHGEFILLFYDNNKSFLGNTKSSWDNVRFGTYEVPTGTRYFRANSRYSDNSSFSSIENVGIGTNIKAMVVKGSEVVSIGKFKEASPLVQSQLSVLNDNINLRVTKGDVTSQINIEAERTLIQTGKLLLDAKNTIVTGDFAVSGNAIVGGDMQLNKGLRVMNGANSVLSVVNGNVRMNVGSLFIGSEDLEDKVDTAIYQNSKSLGLIYTDRDGQEQSLLSIGADGVYVEGKHIILNGQTIVNDDFTVTGGNVVLNADTTILGDFTVSGDNVVLDGDTIVTGDFAVLGENIILDGNTTVRDNFTVTGGNIILDGKTTVHDDFTVTGGNVILNADTRVQGDFIVSGGNVILDGNTTVRGGFTVLGENVTLDANTTILGDFSVFGKNITLDADTTILGDFSVYGKNITLDGDTIVTGDFTVAGDIVGPGIRADHITAGELDAGQITVVNLDVSSLSGNTAEFITTSFNGINGSTQIDADGIYMSGFGFWRRTYLTPTGFDLYNEGGNNKSGAIGYFKPTLEESRSDENIIEGTLGSRHTIGIVANSTHNVAIGYGGVNSRSYKRAINVDGTDGLIRIYTKLSPRNSDYQLEFTAYDVSSARGTAFTTDTSGIMFASNGTKIWDESGKVWDDYDMTTRRKIGFYGDSGVQVLTTNKDMEIWAGGESVRFYVGTNELRFRVGRGSIQAYTDIGMNGNIITGQSDERLKTNVRAREELIINKLKQFNFVDFDWIESGKSAFGLIAQQVQKFAPELVSMDETNMLTLNNTLLNMYTTKSVVEINQKVDDLTESTDDKIHKLQQELSKANRRIEELEGAI